MMSLSEFGAFDIYGSFTFETFWKKLNLGAKFEFLKKIKTSILNLLWL